jgi:hypothetical protein
VFGELLQEQGGQFGDFVTPLPERRQGDADHVQAEEEILAERSVADGHLEIAVRRSEDADVDPDIMATAEPSELAVLQHLQQLGLQRRQHFADFVQEHRAVVRELELARFVLDRAREGAPFEAEEFGLEQLRWQRGAVDLDEWLVAPRRCGMDRPGDELLARSALATDEDGDVGVGDALDELVHLAHFLVAPQEDARDTRSARALGRAKAHTRVDRQEHAISHIKAVHTACLRIEHVTGCC